jgi:hypothetical protein
MRPDPDCEKYGKVETMEHMLCEYYSELLWNRLVEIFTQLYNSTLQTRCQEYS